MEKLHVKIIIEDGSIAGVYVDTEDPVDVEFLDFNSEFGSEGGSEVLETLQHDPNYRELDQYSITHYRLDEEV